MLSVQAFRHTSSTLFLEPRHVTGLDLSTTRANVKMMIFNTFML